MANVHLHFNSFNAGELSPLIGSRFGVEKLASGCRLLRNFIPHVHGPVFRRPGFEYMGPAGGNGYRSKLVAFNFSTTTGALLEFHPNGLRVWSGGVIVPLRDPVPLPYSETECDELQLLQVNDVFYIVHPNHAPRKLVRYSDDDWRISELVFDFPALGDENERSDQLATPARTEKLRVGTYEWPDWLIPAGGVELSVISADTSGAQKTLKFQRRKDSGEWETRMKLQWTTVAPSPVSDVYGEQKYGRMTYDGPVAGAGSIGRVTWMGSGGGAGDLPLDVNQPTQKLEGVIPTGEYEAKVSSTADIPNGAKLYLERWTGSVWVQVTSMRLSTSQTTTYRGTVTGNTAMRFRWVAGRAMMGGVATVESLVFPPSEDVTLQVDATEGEDKTMTASEPIFEAGHVGSFWQITHRRDEPWTRLVSTEPTITADTSDPVRINGRWQVLSYGSWAATLYLEKEIAGNWEVVRSWSSKKDRNVAADGEEDDALMRLRISDGTSEAVSGAAVPRFVLEAFDSAVNGLVKITAVGALDADGKSTTATVDIIKPLHAITATKIWTEGAWSVARGWPRAVALHGGRLFLAGVPGEPTRVWGSVINDYENFKRGSLDDSGVSFTPAAQQANGIQWMLSHEKDLIIGTSGDEWTLGAENGPITPTNVLMQRRSGYGSTRAQAVMLNEAVAFVQRGGRKVRQIAPRADSIAWSAADLTVLAEHLTLEGVTSLAVMTNPFTILWAVCGGKLLGMTFEAEQNVFGWHVHETEGEIESVAVIRGVDCDEVWVCVLRGTVRSIERMAANVFLRDFADRETLVYLDAARSYAFESASDTVDGLDHLEGQLVSVMADGAEQSKRRVIDGAIMLEFPATNVVVGLSYTSKLQPSRIDVPLRDGTAQGRQFRVSRVGLTVQDSLGGEISDAPDGRFQEINYRQMSSPMDSAPGLYSGNVEMTIESRHRDGIDVIIQQRSPLPLNIAAIIAKFDISGE